MLNGEGQYRLLFESHPSPMWVFDEETLGFLAVNDAALTQYGYSRDEFLSLTIKDIRPAEDVPAVIEAVQQQRGVRAASTGVWRHRRKDGTLFEVETTGSSITFQGRPGRLTLCQDITVRRQAEERLLVSEERLQQAVRVSGLGVFDHDHRTDIIHWSPEMRQIHGFGPNDPVTIPDILNTVYPDDREMMASAIRKAHDPTGDGLYAIDHRIIRQDGRLGWLSRRSQTFFEGEGESRRPVRSIGAVMDITERRQAEELLRRAHDDLEQKVRERTAELTVSEQRLSLVFQTSPAAIFVGRRADGLYLDANEAWLQIFGYSAADVIGHTSLELNLWVVPSDRDRILHMLHEQGRIANCELQFRRKSGEIADVLLSAMPLDLFGVPCMVGTLADVTNDKRAQGALRQAEEKNWAILHTIPDQIVRIRRDGVYLESMTPPNFESAWAEQDYIGKRVADVLPPERATALLAALDQAFQTGHVQSLEYTVVLADGQARYREARLMPMNQDEAMMLIREITDRKRAEMALQEAHQFNEQIIRSVQEGIVVYGRDLKIHVWNPYMEQLTGFPAQEVVGKNTLEQFPFLGDHGVDQMYDQALAGATPPAREFPFNIPETGRSGWASDTCAPLRNAAGEIIGVIGAVDDITKRRHMEEQLETSNRMLEDLTVQLRLLASRLTQAERLERQRIGALIHDQVQQLLAAAKLRVGMLGPQVTGSPATELISQIRDLLTQAIAISRSLAYEVSPPVMREIGLSAALDWLAEDVQSKHGLAVRLQSEAEIREDPEGVCDLLYQCVRELLLNVAKHANAKSATIALRRLDDQRVQIVVQDDGVGFDPGEPSTSKASKRGFGLVSIRERLGLLGGLLVIDSAPGQGSRFTLEASVLPQPEPGEANSPLAPEQSDGVLSIAPSTGPGRRIRVIMADDHVMMRQGLAEILSCEDDLEVVGEAADGAEAVQLAVQLKPDVVVMDVRMPGMNGLDATRRIKAAVPGVQVIGLSLHDDPKTAKAMQAAGASVFLAKDGPIEMLVAAVRAAAVARRPRG